VATTYALALSDSSKIRADYFWLNYEDDLLIAISVAILNYYEEPRKRHITWQFKKWVGDFWLHYAE
jgi:hypothetical protein